jgi:hypothetical protein
MGRFSAADARVAVAPFAASNFNRSSCSGVHGEVSGALVKTYSFREPLLFDQTRLAVPITPSCTVGSVVTATDRSHNP